MKIGGMGEQAVRVQQGELRRIHELPEEVQILGILSELPYSPEVTYVDSHKGPKAVLVYDQMRSPPLPADWVPHPRPSAITPRCLYIHVQHRYCFRGVEQGAPLTIETLDEFLSRFKSIAEDEASRRGQKIDPDSADAYGHWVDDDA